MVKKMAVLDWHAMKYHHKRIPLVLFFGFFIGMFFSAPFVIPSCAMMSLIFSINAFAVEEKGELNNLYLTLPVNRSSIVEGRFVLSLIMGLCGIIAGIPIMLLTNHIGFSHYYYPVSWNMFIIAFAYLFFSICNLATYPLLFRFGYSKGKIWGFYIPLLVIGIIYGGIQTALSTEEYKSVIFDILVFSGKHELMISTGLILLGTFVLFISFVLSKHLYQKRDF